MSIAADLQVKLGADPSGLVSGMKTAETAVKATKLSLGDLQDLLKQLQRERPQIVDDAQLKQYNQTISALKTNIKDLQTVGVSGFDELGKKVSSTSGPLKEAYSGVYKLANILPGIGVGGLVALGFEAAAAAIESFAGSVGQAEAAQRKLNETVGAGSASVQGEVAAMTDLAAIALDNANSTDIRKKAFTELQSLYPGYLGNLQFEKTSYEDLQVALDRVTSALVRQAQIKGLEGAITDTFKELNKTIAEGGTTFQKVTANVSGFVAALGDTKANFNGIGGLFDNLGKAFDAAKQGSIAHSLDVDTSESQHQVDLLNAKLKELLGDSLKNNDALLKFKPPPTGPIIDTLAKTGDALKEIVRLEGELGKPDTQPLFQRLAKSIDPSQAQVLENQIAQVLRDNVKNGIDKAITDKEVGLIQEKLRRLLNPDLTTKIDTRVEVNPIVAADVATFEKTFPPTLEALLGKLPAIKTDIKVDPNLVLKETDFAKANDKIKQTIGNAGASIAEGLAADFGKAFAGVKNPFGDIAELLGNGLEEIGKQLIIVGGLSQLIQKLLPTVFTPAGAITSIAVGALAIAAGAALKAISSTKGVKAFAEGGIVTGPTNALIGEAGPEVVFPLDKLNRFIKGNTQSSRVEVVGQTIISGPNLITVLKRAQTNQGMV